MLNCGWASCTSKARVWHWIWAKPPIGFVKRLTKGMRVRKFSWV